MVCVDGIDARLMPLMMDQMHTIGRMNSVLGKVGRERVEG